MTGLGEVFVTRRSLADAPRDHARAALVERLPGRFIRPGVFGVSVQAPAGRDRRTPRCFDYDALAWARQADERSGKAQGAMDRARGIGSTDARMLDQPGVIVRRILSGS